MTAEDVRCYKLHALFFLHSWVSTEGLAGLGKNNITPYLHKMVHHVPVLLSRWGPMRAFSTDALERDVRLERAVALEISSFQYAEFYSLIYDFARCECPSLNLAKVGAAVQRK